MTESLGVPSSPDAPETDAGFLRVYEQMRALARQFLFEQAPGHTLQATALVHEVWLRLQRGGSPSADPQHFQRLAATAMRHVLIDHARRRTRQKRGGRREKLTLDAVALASDGDTDEILAVDEAIERLRAAEPVLAELVHLRFFAGLTVEEAAASLGQSVRSTYRDWDYAKTLLLRELRRGEA